MQHLKALSELPGVSGNEYEVRKYLREALKDEPLNISTDAIGNLIITSLNGNEREKLKQNKRLHLMMAAHMDEIGLMVTGIEKSGLIRFKKVGSIDERILVSRQVLVGKEKILGIIGGKAIHLQKPEERQKPYQLSNLYIDVGSKDKEDAEKIVKIGDYVSLKSKFRSMGDGCFMGKAFDNRSGCAILLELLLDRSLPHFTVVFTVQEEVGLRGAVTAAHSVQPDLAIVVETTIASDVPETKEHRQSTNLGGGPALSLMDASMVVNKELTEKIIRVAEKNKIPYQLRRFTGGGTDAGPITISREGVKTAVVSVPCRYIHSPHSILNHKDWQYTLELLRSYIKENIAE